MYDAGTAFLQVAPSFRGIEAEFQRQAEKIARQVDDAISKAVPEGMREGLRQASKVTKAEAKKTGESYANAFKSGVSNRVEGILRKLPEIDLTPDTKPVDRALAQLRKDIADIPNLRLGIDLDEEDLAEELRRVEQNLRRIGRTAELAEQRSDAKAAAKRVRELRDFVAAEGRVVGGAFAESMSRELDAAAKAFPEIRLDRKTKPAEQAIARLRERIEQLRDVKIGVDISQRDFFVQLAQIRSEVERFASQDLDVELGFNAKKAIARLEAVRKAAEERYSGAFDAVFKQRLKAAQEALGDVGPATHSRRANAALDQIQARMKTLSESDIDVDIPADGYMAELKALETALDTVVKDKTVNVRVRANAKKALDEVQAAMGDLERRAKDDGDKSGGAFADAFAKAVKEGLAAIPEVDLKGNPTSAQQAIGKVRDELADLGKKEIGVNLNATTARLRLAELEARLRRLAATTVDVDVRTNALAAAGKLKEFQDRLNEINGRSAANALEELAKRADYGMSRLGFLISIGSSLGTAIVPGAAAAAVAISGIATAAAAAVIGLGVIGLGLMGVGKAVSALDKYQKDANKSAHSLSGAENRVANALSGVNSAQRALGRAERDRKKAVDDLVKAQERAKRQLEDMAISVKDNALAQRQAKLDEAEAKRELDKVLADKNASEEEREQARITFEERTLQLERLGLQQGRLKKDTEEANKKGVQGSDEVRAAQERILDATESVISAQESLVQSQRSMTQAVQATGVAGGEALDNLQEAMDELSPAGQRFARFLFGIKDEVKQTFQFPAEQGLLPGLETGIRNLLGYRPQLSAFIRDVGSAVGSTFVKMTEELNDPTWRRFFNYIAATAGPSITGMAQASFNAARGVVALVVALSPFNKRMGSGLIEMTESFATWAERLRTTTGFQRFMSYVEENGPIVIDVLKQVATFIGRIVVAAAPVGSVVLKSFDALFGLINKIPIPILTALVALMAAVATVMLLGAARTALMTLAANLSAVATRVQTVAQTAYNAVLTQYQVIAAGAIARTGQLSTSMAIAAGTAATARVGLGAIMSMLGGPWGIAIGAATIAITAFAAAEQKAENQARESVDALGRIASAFEQGGDAAVSSLARQDRAVAEAIIKLRQYGIASREVFRASQGDIKAQEAVLEAMRGQVKRLKAEIAGFLKGDNELDLLPGEDNDEAVGRKMKEIFELERRLKELQAQYELTNAATEGYNQATEESAKADKAAAAAAEMYGSKVEALQGVHDALTGKITDASRAASAFRAYIDEVSGAAISAVEAQEEMIRSQIDLREQLRESGTELDLTKAKTDEQRKSILASRDALEDALRASREKALADIKSGISLDKVTEANEDRIRAILEEIPAAERNTQVVKDLVAAYGAIPAKVPTEFQVVGAEQVFKQLQELQIAQYALANQITVPEARAKLAGRLSEYQSQVPAAARRAHGGLVTGPGGPTEDAIPAWLSNREYIIPARVVDEYGVSFFDQMIGRRTPGYAKGGLVGDPASYILGRILKIPMPVSVLKTKLPTIEELAAKYNQFNPMVTGAAGEFPPWPRSPGAQRGDSGVWRLIHAMVQKSGISNHFGNSYRHGDPLWHGSGRAIDYMGYNQDRLANFFLSMRPKVLELIHTTPLGGYYVTRGVRKSSMGDQDELHRNHLHIAMDSGGWIKPGWNPPIWNGTGRPEPVLTGHQWDSVMSLARGGDGATSGHTYNFEFRDSTLDAGRLRALQDREAVLSRQGRAR